MEVFPSSFFRVVLLFHLPHFFIGFLINTNFVQIRHFRFLFIIFFFFFIFLFYILRGLLHLAAIEGPWWPIVSLQIETECADVWRLTASSSSANPTGNDLKHFIFFFMFVN
jgi:hypothetical protein